MAGMKEAFAVLSKGVVVSINSQKHHEIANFLNVDENFEAFDETVGRLGYRLEGESGYFFLVRDGRLSGEELERFVTTHKKLIVAVALLKQIYPLIGVGETLTQTRFTAELLKKEDETIQQMLRFIGSGSDTKTLIEAFFKLLEKHDLIEHVAAEDRDRYKVLNSYSYYVKIVESAF